VDWRHSIACGSGLGTVSIVKPTVKGTSPSKQCIHPKSDRHSLWLIGNASLLALTLVGSVRVTPSIAHPPVLSYFYKIREAIHLVVCNL
jgi:hypothetical protein